MFLKILKAEFIKHSHSWLAYLMLFGGFASIGYVVSIQISANKPMSTGFLMLSVLYLYPVLVAFVSDMLAQADAKNWPLLYTKNIRFQYILAKFVHLTILSLASIGAFAFVLLYPLEGRLLEYGLSAEVLRNAAWLLFFLWIASIPTFFLFAYASSVLSTFVVSMLAIVSFIIYPVGRDFVMSTGHPSAKTLQDIIGPMDKILPTSLPSRLNDRIKPAKWMRTECPAIIKVEERDYNEDEKGAVYIATKTVERCAYDETLERVFGFEPKKLFDDVANNGEGAELLYAWIASLVLSMILSFFHLREREV